MKVTYLILLSLFNLSAYSNVCLQPLKKKELMDLRQKSALSRKSSSGNKFNQKIQKFFIPKLTNILKRCKKLHLKTTKNLYFETFRTYNKEGSAWIDIGFSNENFCKCVMNYYTAIKNTPNKTPPSAPFYVRLKIEY